VTDGFFSRVKKKVHYENSRPLQKRFFLPWKKNGGTQRGEKTTPDPWWFKLGRGVGKKFNRKLILNNKGGGREKREGNEGPDWGN